MSAQNTQMPDTNSVLEIAENALNSANSQIQCCTKEIRLLGPEVRATAMKTIDVLLSNPSQTDIDRRKKEVVVQYSKLLFTFSRNMEKPIKELNSSWMTVEQSMGFFLLSSGRDANTDLIDVRRLIDVMTEAQQQVPPAKSEIGNLSDAIKGSAGGLHGLEDSIEAAITTLKRLNEELGHGYAIFGRQIKLAKQLYELMVEN